jgi:FdhD protein
MIRRVPGDGGRVPDDVIVEEPLEIRLDGARVATTMRTPGHDFELAVGFCHAEGLLGDVPVREVRYCATGSAVETRFNVVSVETGRPPLGGDTRRSGVVSSSCGVCGSDSIEALTEGLAPLPDAEIDLEVVLGVRPAGQELFERTGGVHAAAVFSLNDGAVQLLREDIGRHNAVDKVVGALRLAGALPASRSGLWVSGRASFEIVQKAWAAGMPVVVSVSAASALAVETARRAGITLMGFARDGAGVIYDR